MDLRLLLDHRFSLLAGVSAFFLLVLALRAATGKSIPVSKAGLTLKAAAAGLLLAAFDRLLPGASGAEEYVRGLQGLVVLFCAANLFSYLLVDLYLHWKRDAHVPAFLRELLLVAIYLVFAAAALRVVFRIDMTSILTTTTVLTAAVAFAMQTTLANIVSGFYVQADRNLKRGTWVWIKEKEIAGEVVNVGVRYATLRTGEDHRVLVPNNFLMQNIVHTVGCRGDGPAGINIKVQLGYALPPERAKELLVRILRDEPLVLPDPAPSVRLDAFQESGIQYNLRFHVEDYGTILKARDGILTRVWYAVAREGSSLPYPHREVIEKKVVEPFRLEDAEVRGCLRRADILAPLNDEDIDALTKRVRVRVFGSGESVVRQGDAGDSLFIVRRGRLDALIDGARVGTLSEGEFFGEMSLLTGEPRKATVVAVGEARLVEISKTAFTPVIRAHPSVLDGLSASLDQRVEKIRAALEIPGTEEEAPTRREAILAGLRSFFGA